MIPENGPVELELDPNLEERNRLTVGFRALLVIPQLIAALVLGLVAFVLGFLGWWGALFTGRLPHWTRKFMVNYITYVARVEAYRNFLVDEYPPFAFSDPDYPIQQYPVQLDIPAAGRLKRAAVFFRFFLFLPASFLALFLGYGWTVILFFVWLIILITGRLPQAAFDAGAAALRFNARANAYMLMVTASYPTKEVLGDKNPGEVEPRSKTRPLVLSQNGRRLLITMIVVGVIALVAYQTANQIYIQHMLEQRLHHPMH
jgi:hypothetical protein